MAEQINQLLRLIDDPTMLLSLLLGFFVFAFAFGLLLFVTGSRNKDGRKATLRLDDERSKVGTQESSSD